MVRAGEYREQVALKSGVAIVPAPPRERDSAGAPECGAGPAVVAEKVEFARLSGFQIQASAEMPLSAGIVLTDSSVEIDDIEMSGAEIGIVIRGGGRPALRGNAIRDCTGVGCADQRAGAAVAVAQRDRAGTRRRGSRRAEGARPALSGNVFDRNKVELPPDD